MIEMKQIPNVTVDTFVEELGNIYIRAIDKGLPFSMIPAPFLWGAPGVGKSDGVRQLASRIEMHTGKKVVVTDVRLLLFSPIDLRGIPVVNQTRTAAEWLKPSIFAMDPDENVINILFLDELTAAPTSVQAAGYQLTLDRKIGEHSLPDNCIVIGAGNRLTDHSVAYRMPNALANRMQHYEVIADLESWMSWAIKHSVHPLVLGYLAFDNSKFYSDNDEDDVAFPTPRSWMFVSNLLNIMGAEGDLSVLYNTISGCIGSGTALAFLSWCKNHSDLPDVADIFRGKRTKYPVKQDALYALVRSLIAYVESREKQGKITEMELENMGIYAAKFPLDYQACLYSSINKFPLTEEKLKKLPLYKKWLKQCEGL